jgi:transposase
MFLDGAGWHKAHELTVLSNMRLLSLPPYSPELNPAEHVWGDLALRMRIP